MSWTRSLGAAPLADQSENINKICCALAFYIRGFKKYNYYSVIIKAVESLTSQKARENFFDGRSAKELFKWNCDGKSHGII
jgi:hypothetical protein